VPQETAVTRLDDWIAELAQRGGLALVLLVALMLGLAWGTGHALTLALFGLPIVLLQAYLPETAQRAAEAAVGVMIMLLAGRLLLRARLGRTG
jgi:hypothetical protein